MLVLAIGKCIKGRVIFTKISNNGVGLNETR